jgi:hypothetical protein
LTATLASWMARNIPWTREMGENGSVLTSSPPVDPIRMTSLRPGGAVRSSVATFSSVSTTHDAPSRNLGSQRSGGPLSGPLLGMYDSTARRSFDRSVVKFWVRPRNVKTTAAMSEGPSSSITACAIAARAPGLPVDVPGQRVVHHDHDEAADVLRVRDGVLRLVVHPGRTRLDARRHVDGHEGDDRLRLAVLAGS